MGGGSRWSREQDDTGIIDACLTRMPLPAGKCSPLAFDGSWDHFGHQQRCADAARPCGCFRALSMERSSGVLLSSILCGDESLIFGARAYAASSLTLRWHGEASRHKVGILPIAVILVLCREQTLHIVVFHLPFLRLLLLLHDLRGDRSGR